MPKLPQKFDKPKNMSKSFGRLFKYLKTYMPLIIVSAILIISSTIIRLVGPNKLGEITDIVSQSVVFKTPFSMDSIWKIASLLITLYVFGAVFTYIANFLMGRVCFIMSNRLRRDIQDKINKLPLKYIDKVPYGDVLSVVTNDIDIIGQTLHTSVSSLVGAIILFIGSLAMMFITNWLMALCAVASTLIGFG